MIHFVPTSELIKINNPFELSIFDDCSEAIDKDVVAQYMHSGDIFFKSSDTPIDKHLKRIAFEVLNFENKTVSLNAFNQIDNHGEYYVAALIKGVEGINIDLPENHPLTSYRASSVEQTFVDNQFTPINWNIDGPLHNWTNIEYTIQYINKKKSYQKIKELIPDESWSDKEFIHTMFLMDSSETLLKAENSLLTSEMAQSFIDRDLKGFHELWTRLYSCQPHNLHKYFEDNLFNNLDLCKKLLNHSTDYYQFFSKDIQLNPEVVTRMLRDNMGNSYPKYLALIDKDFFNSLDNFNLLLPKFTHSSISCLKPYMFDWIDDKEKIKELFEKNPHKNISNFFQFLPKALAKDKEIILLFLNNDPSTVYRQLAKSQKTKDIVEQYIRIGDLSDIGHEVYKITDIKLIKELVQKKPTFINAQVCPDTWLTDDLLRCAAKSLHQLYLSDDILHPFLDKPENLDYVKSVNTAIYGYLPEKYLLDPDWSLKYFKFLQIEHLDMSFNNTFYRFEHNHVQYIPKAIWCNREFALNALEHTEKAAAFVPKEFFSDKIFIREIFKIIDDKKNTKLLSILPPDIQELLDKNDITENYSQFINQFVLNHELNSSKPSEKKKKI